MKQAPRIESLEVVRFRNLEAQTVAFSKRVTVIVGRNGQGKTSLLEAIYLLAHVRSFRIGTNRDFVQWKNTLSDSDSAAEHRRQKNSDVPAIVNAKLSTEDGDKYLGFEIVGGRRKVSFNGKPIESAKSFYGNVRVVEFSPDDLSLVKGPPQDRRILLDKILTQVDGAYVESLVQYHRALKQRNKLLQQGIAGARSQWLEKIQVWDRVLVQTGRELVTRRSRLLADFVPLVEASYQEILGDNSGRAQIGEHLTAEYSSHFAREGELLGEAELLEIYREKLESDLSRQSTRFGPHRDDLSLKLQTTSIFRDARTVASQGQARSIALSLKLAAVKAIANACGEAPLLLLDDVESELDAGRRAALVRIISELNSQVIITTTDSSTIAEQFSDQCFFLQIEGGKVVENRLEKFA